MKKLMTIGLAAAMMFAMAGKASATALETSGELRARYWTLGNYFETGKSSEFWDSRLRLTMVWPVAEGVKVTARADINEGFWGDQMVSATTTPAGTTYSAAPNAKKAVDWDQLNLSFVWPNSPITIVVGRQTTTWGPGFFVANDNRDRFRIHAKFDATTVFYTYDKYGEVVNLHDTAGLDDWSQHTIGAVSTVAGVEPRRDRARMFMNDITQGTNETRYVVDALRDGQGRPRRHQGRVRLRRRHERLQRQGRPGCLGLRSSTSGATMPVGPVTVGFEGAYVSGDDPTTAKNEGAFASDYQSPFWSIILFNNLDYNGYQNESVTGPAPADSGMKNAWGIKPSVSVPLMPGLSLYGAVVYAARIEDVKSGRQVTTADPLGTEIDVIVNYAITPNVSWTGRRRLPGCRRFLRRRGQPRWCDERLLGEVLTSVPQSAPAPGGFALPGLFCRCPRRLQRRKGSAITTRCGSDRAVTGMRLFGG